MNQGAAWKGQDSRAAFLGNFGKLQVGMDPSLGKASQIQPWGAREGLESGANPPELHPGIFGGNLSQSWGGPGYSQWTAELGSSRSHLGWDWWDKHGIVLGGHQGSPGPMELQEKWEKDPKNPVVLRDGTQIQSECRIWVLQTPPRSKKAPNPTQNQREKPRGGRRHPRVRNLCLGFGSQNFSTRDVAAAVAPGLSQPRFPKNSPQGIWGHHDPSHNSCLKFHPKAASSQLLLSPSQQELGLDLEQSAKKSRGASSSDCSPGNTQKNPRKIPPFPAHRC